MGTYGSQADVVYMNGTILPVDTFKAHVAPSVELDRAHSIACVNLKARLVPHIFSALLFGSDMIDADNVVAIDKLERDRLIAHRPWKPPFRWNKGQSRTNVQD